MILAPSVLSLDFSKFSESVELLNENVKFLHFDVMDGHFVPNLSFGSSILKAFRKNSSLFLDVHLMVDNPFDLVDSFILAGADSITFHIEAFNNDTKEAIGFIKKIKSNYLKVGVSIKPNTPVKVIEPLLPFVDLVLVMSVEPGFGGQEFIPQTYEKIKYLSKYRDESNLKYLIEVDGGVNEKNASELVKIGTNILVAGSYIFNGDIKSNIDRITNICKQK